MLKPAIIFASLVYTLNTSAHCQFVKIGTQLWSAKNLDVSTFRNGDSIPQAKTVDEWKSYAKSGKPAWCYYDNDSRYDTIYGKLYNWFALIDPRGLAPNGYHIPSDIDWTVLIDFLGGEFNAESKLKSEIGWDPEWDSEVSSNKTKGFSALPGGIRLSNGVFKNVGVGGYWWSSSEYLIKNAWERCIGCEYNTIERNYAPKGSGLSVRYLKD